MLVYVFFIELGKHVITKEIYVFIPNNKTLHPLQNHKALPPEASKQ